MASYDENGINTTLLAKNLSEISGVTDSNSHQISDDTEITLPQNIMLNNYKFRIKEDGQVERFFPKEFQEVEYIESTGMQAINTQIKASSHIKIETLVDRPISPSTGTIWLPFGSNADPNNGQYKVFESTSNVKYVALLYGQASTSNLINNGGVNSFTKSKFVLENGVLTFDNGAKIINSSQESQTFTTTNDIYLFSIPNTSNNYSEVIIYYTKMWFDEKLVRNFIPCYRKSDDVIGLYDTVEGKFYTNQGTGTFGYGMEDGTYVAPKNN